MHTPEPSPALYPARTVTLSAEGISDVGGGATLDEAFLVSRLGGDRAPASNVPLDLDPTPPTTLLAVARGLGARGMGAAASRAVVRTLARHAPQLSLPDDESEVPALSSDLQALLSRCHAQARRLTGTSDPEPCLHLATAVVSPPWLVIGHLGRAAVFLRRGSRDMGPQLERLTPDIATSGVGAMRLQPGDRVLLTTGGLLDAMSLPRIRATLDACALPREACWKLYGAACEAGADANVTVVVADLAERQVGESVVSRVFDDATEATLAIERLRDAHFTSDDISVLGRDDTRVEEATLGTRSPVERSATAGAVAGAALGGVLAATGAIPIGLGVVALGPIAAAVHGVAAGGGLGAVAGAIGGLGYLDDTPEFDAVDLETGRVWVGVHCASPERAGEARDCLEAA